MEQKDFYDTVIDLFNHRGVKFTLDQVAAELRISKRTIYEQYGNKEEVMLQAVRHYFTALKEEERVVIDNAGLPLIEKIRKVITMYPPLYINYTQVEALRRSYPQVNSEILHQFDQNWENTFSLIEQAFEEKVLHPFRMETLKIILLGIFQEVIEYDEEVQQKTILQCLDFVLKGYKL